jgi:hypothetical protein
MLSNLKYVLKQILIFQERILFSPFLAQKHRCERVKQVFKKGWLVLVYQLYCTVRYLSNFRTIKNKEETSKKKEDKLLS